MDEKMYQIQKLALSFVLCGGHWGKRILLLRSVAFAALASFISHEHSLRRYILPGLTFSLLIVSAPKD